MVRLLNACRKTGNPIIHIIRLYRADGSGVDLCRRELIRSGTSHKYCSARVGKGGTGQGTGCMTIGYLRSDFHNPGGKLAVLAWGGFTASRRVGRQ